ncbi:MAG: SIS domain-containing protein [Terriglobia bacterium]
MDKGPRRPGRAVAWEAGDIKNDPPLSWRDDSKNLLEVGILNVKEAAREMPGALKAVTAERPNYSKSIHQARWAEGPVFIIGQGTAVHAACAAAQAFEYLLGWPAMAREASGFLNHSLAVLRPRAALIAVSTSGEDEDLVEVVQQASRRGASALALTANPESRLAQTARAILPLPGVPSGLAPLVGPLVEQMALFEIAAVAARIFNPRNPHVEALETEFEKLPERIPWMRIHLIDPIRSCALQLKGSRRLLLVGGNFYYPVATQAVALARLVTPRIIEAVEIESAAEFHPAVLGAADAFLLLSSSRCRGKKAVHALATKLKKSAAKVLAVTDGNDHDLINHSEFSVLMPDLPEVSGSLLTMVFLQWLILECAATKGV